MASITLIINSSRSNVYEVYIRLNTFLFVVVVEKIEAFAAEGGTVALSCNSIGCGLVCLFLCSGSRRNEGDLG